MHIYCGINSVPPLDPGRKTEEWGNIWKKLPTLAPPLFDLYVYMMIHCVANPVALFLSFYIWM